MSRTWTPTDKTRANMRLAKAEGLHQQRIVRLETAQAKVDRARAARDKIQGLVDDASDAERDATQARWRMDLACHACGNGFALGEATWSAYSADGAERVGHRCEPCQVVARKISPPSVFGTDWKRFANSKEG